MEKQIVTQKTKNYSVKPTDRHKKAFKKMVENGGNKGLALKDAGYSYAVIKTPQKVTESKGWNELLDQHLSDSNLAEKHKELLNSTTLDHMVFPQLRVDDPETKKKKKYGEELTDDDIRQMLADVNCKVRKIVHGEQARHVYFWSTDNTALKNALELAYKIKGRMQNKEGGDVHNELNWYQIIHEYHDSEPKKQRVEVIEPIQDNQQEGEVGNISEKPSTKTIQRRKGTKKSYTKITPAWIYDRRND